MVAAAREASIERMEVGRWESRSVDHLSPHSPTVFAPNWSGLVRSKSIAKNNAIGCQGPKCLRRAERLSGSFILLRGTS